jgi:hypothetical protein
MEHHSTVYYLSYRFEFTLENDIAKAMDPNVSNSEVLVLDNLDNAFRAPK